MADVSDNPVKQTHTADPLQFTADLRKGKELFGGSTQAQTLVDSRLGAGNVTPHAINFAPVAEIIPYTHNGCRKVQGEAAERTYDSLQADGTEALNIPRPPGAPQPQDQAERDLAERVYQNTFQHPNQTEDEQYDNILTLQEPFKHMDKDQTQRVIDSANQKLADTGFRYAQTQDGAVWLGYRNPRGLYQATVYMRPPECEVG